MKLLLRLYPRCWRNRYQPEMEALLHRTRLTPAVAWDLFGGALDARIHPQWPARRAGRHHLSGTEQIALAATLAFVLGSGGFMIATILWPGDSWLAALGATISVALGLLLTGWRLRRRRRRTHDSGDDPGGTAAVPARPRPDAPPTLSAVSPGSGRRSDRE